MEKGNSNSSPEITVKLTTKGVYLWQIKFPYPEGGSNEFVVSQIESIDRLLKSKFPYAKVGGGKVVTFDEFED